MTIGMVLVAFPRREGRLGHRHDEHIRIQPDELGRVHIEELDAAQERYVGVAVVDRDVLPLDIAQVAQAPLKRLHESARRGGRTEEADPAHGTRRLRTGADWRDERDGKGDDHGAPIDHAIAC
jgi:hypothetical protein